MATNELSIDWQAFAKAGKSGKLMDLLAKLPVCQWGELDSFQTSLLQYACRGSNVDSVIALLKSKMVDVNSRSWYRYVAVHRAAWKAQSRTMEILCAAGADMRILDNRDLAPLDWALEEANKDDGKTVRVLIANGVRLNTIEKTHHRFITPEMAAFEKGVLKSRLAVVAIIRAGQISKLSNWDKFLLKEMAVCVWATRYDKAWSQE